MTRAWGHVVETVSNALRPFLSVGSTVETSIAIASSHSLSVCVWWVVCCACGWSKSKSLFLSFLSFKIDNFMYNKDLSNLFISFHVWSKLFWLSGKLNLLFPGRICCWICGVKVHCFWAQKSLSSVWIRRFFWYNWNYHHVIHSYLYVLLWLKSLSK